MAEEPPAQDLKQEAKGTKSREQMMYLECRVSSAKRGRWRKKATRGTGTGIGYAIAVGLHKILTNGDFKCKGGPSPTLQCFGIVFSQVLHLQLMVPVWFWGFHDLD